MKTNTRQPVRETNGHGAPPKPPRADSALEDRLQEALPALRRAAPEGFAERVMARVADRPSRARPALRTVFFRHWMMPAAAGAAAAVLVMLGLRTLPGSSTAPRAEAAVVQFVFHAPGAKQVELVGDFTDWQTGRILLEGPDDAGRWTTRIALPEGRHEYLFLVDGRSWQTDPLAQVRRPDGFGNLNAVMNL